MRQAGRYMPEYRQLREKHTLLELCHTPELAREVTMQPLRRFDLDAAILFSDILLPLEPMGLDFEFAKGEGPVVHRPVRSAADAAALRDFDPVQGLDYVLEAIRLIQRDLAGRIPLLGFCGAPFTLASYMIEGGSSRHYVYTKRMMYTDPDTWHHLLEHLVTMLGRYLLAQIEAGVDAVQIFDSWAGALSPQDYASFVRPHTVRLMQTVVAAGVPIIHFVTPTSGLLDQLVTMPSDVLSVDWRVRLADVWPLVGDRMAVQGNLDPVLLFAPDDLIRQRTQQIIEQATGQAGFIFNLGHGILPETPMEAIDTVLKTVRAGIV
jgi:uroporphyrinogen decarboxylase